MASSTKTKGVHNKAKWIIGSVVGIFVLFILVAVFGTPSAEAVFKDMNEKMLETKSVTIDQKLSMKGSAEINSRLFLDLNSSSELLAKGSFSNDITSSDAPISVAGDLIKVGESNYIRYSDISSSDNRLAPNFTAVESKVKDNWIKTRASDQFSSFATVPLEFTSSILPTPFANLSDVQQKSVLVILQNKSMYTINESSKVDTAGVSAYKYSIAFSKDQFKKAAKAIAGYVSYFKADDSNDSEITSFTVWVNISTKQIIKIEYTGTTKSGDVTGAISFSGYDQSQTVEKPSDYLIESELLNN